MRQFNAPKTTPVNSAHLKPKRSLVVPLTTIWTSPDNSYQKQDINFTLSESVESCPASREPVAKATVRALNIGGFSLLDPFVALPPASTTEAPFATTDGPGLRAKRPACGYFVSGYIGLLSAPGNPLFRHNRTSRPTSTTTPVSETWRSAWTRATGTEAPWTA